MSQKYRLFQFFTIFVAKILIYPSFTNKFMSIQGNTIIFKYNARYSYKLLFWLGWILLVLLFVANLIVDNWRYDTWKEIFLSACKTVGLVFPAILILWVVAFIQKMKQIKKLSISISPEGVTDSKGRLIPMKDIDHCHLEYNDYIPYYKDTPMPYSATPENLVILLKTGKTQKIKIRLYDAPSDPESVDFHQTANRILGIPCLFTERVVVHVKGVIN